MSTIVINTQLTLAERLRRTAPDGSSLAVAQVLDQTNGLMRVLPTVAANGINEHKEAETASEPAGSYVDYNEFAERVATGSAANHFRIAKIKVYSTPAKDLIDDDPDPQGKRAQEVMGIQKGVFKTVANDLIYGNSAKNSKKFTGLEAFLHTVNNTTVIDNGGTGSDLTSIYAVAPGVDTVFMVHPKHNPSFGVQHTDKGTGFISDAATNTKDLEVYRDEIMFNGGFVVKDRRAIGRIANIESAGVSNIFNEDKLIRLNAQMAEFADNLIYFVNRTMLEQIWIRAKDKNNVFLDFDHAFGHKIVTMFGRPVMLHDKIRDTEDAITT